MTAAPNPHGRDPLTPSSGYARSDVGVETQAVSVVSPPFSSPLATAEASDSLSSQGDASSSSVFLGKRVVQRGLIGLAALGCGGAALGIWGSSLSYRWLHVTTDYAVVNGRTITVKAPERGTIQDFFARPGASVSAGQPLARINFVADDSGFVGGVASPEEMALQFQAASLELAAQQQELAMLEQQAQSLNVQASQLAAMSKDSVRLQREEDEQQRLLELQQLRQQQAVQQGAVELASAKLSEAKTKAKAAKQVHQRYKSLWEQQLIAQQKVDELAADWEIAQDQIIAQQAALAAAQQKVQMTQEQMAIAASTPSSQPVGDQLRQQQLSLSLQQQQQKIQQNYQTSMAKMPGLQVKVEQLKSQMAKVNGQGLNPIQPLGDLPAPFAGVVYQTSHDAGEQVERSDELLTLLDCEDLWVETLVTSKDAERIDESQPVSVYLKDKKAPVVGQVDLIESVSGLSVVQNREQRLLPALPAHMQQQALARVTVRLAPENHVQAANRFCGVGQMASLSFGTQRSQSKLPFLSAFSPSAAQ